MTDYKVDERGWIPKAVADIRNGDSLVLVMSPETVRSVAEHAKKAADAVAASGLVGFLVDKLPGASLPAPPFDPSAVVAALAEMGAVGGAAGSVAVVCAIAHERGYTVDLTLRVPPKLSGVEGRAEMFVGGTP